MVLSVICFILVNSRILNSDVGSVYIFLSWFAWCLWAILESLTRFGGYPFIGVVGCALLYLGRIPNCIVYFMGVFPSCSTGFFSHVLRPFSRLLLLSSC